MAARDAQRAMKNGDYRLLAVYGFTTEVPGTDLSAYEAKDRYGVRVIEGTSDDMRWPGEKWLNDNARAYAEKYNRTIALAAPRRCVRVCGPFEPAEPPESWSSPH
jgi:hypothetical protein